MTVDKDTPEELFRKDSCLTQNPHSQKGNDRVDPERNNICVLQTCREKTGFFPFLFLFLCKSSCMAIMHVFLLFLSATENNYFGKQFVLRPSDLGTLHIIFIRSLGRK